MVFCSTPTFFAIVVIAQVYFFGLDMHRSRVLFGLEMHLKNGFFGLEMLDFAYFCLDF